MSFRGFRANMPGLPHPLGLTHLTSVTIGILAASVSPVARLLAENGLVKVETGSEPLMTLAFDDGTRSKAVDVRPALPLVLKY